MRFERSVVCAGGEGVSVVSAGSERSLVYEQFVQTAVRSGDDPSDSCAPIHLLALVEQRTEPAEIHT